MTPKEAEQLGQLLLSKQEENITLALTLLEKQPNALVAIRAQVLVYYFFSYVAPAKRLEQMMNGTWRPFYFMTQEGRELEPRELLQEWLMASFEGFDEKKHCLHALSHHNMDITAIMPVPYASKLPLLQELKDNLAALPPYLPFINQRVTWATAYGQYALYLTYLLEGEKAMALDQLERWEYQKIILTYWHHAQQQHPQDSCITTAIHDLLQKTP
ncbi:MAG: hypothetical protein ACRBFS_02620 [Aureispira sp.]